MIEKFFYGLFWLVGFVAGMVYAIVRAVVTHVYHSYFDAYLAVRKAKEHGVHVQLWRAVLFCCWEGSKNLLFLTHRIKKAAETPVTL